MIKVKIPDYVENADSEVMIDGGSVEVKASKAVVEDGILILSKRTLLFKLVEVQRFYPQEWVKYE